MRILIFGLVAAAGAFFIVFQIIKFFFSISNPKSRVTKDRKFGLIKLRELADGLVPFDHDELKILSIEREASLQRKTFHSEEFGKLYTIYNEPLVAYYLFDYLDDRKLLLSETNTLDIELYRENNSTAVWVNGKLSYTIDSRGNLSRVGAEPNTLASIHSNNTNQYSSIIIKGETRAHLIRNGEPASTRSRAYPVIEIQDEEEAILCYCLTLYQAFEL